MSNPKRAYLNNAPTSPQCQVTLPKTVPLPSLKRHLAEQEVLRLEEEAKWAKTQAEYQAAKEKAEAEGTEAPKAPVRPAPKKEEGDLRTPVPQAAQDKDLLHLAEALGSDVEEIFEQSGELTCQVKRGAIAKALKRCKEDPALRYEMLADATATHYPAGQGFAFSVVYHLTSISRRKRLRLRILVPERVEVESAVALYPSANWMEREIYDMFGIHFIHHPDLTRILNADNWEGFPLRKDYPVTGWGERDVDFRDDRSGRLQRMALEKAGQIGINLKVPVAE